MEAGVSERLRTLQRFVGSWSIEPLLPDGEAPPELRGSVTFEWLPDGGFLLERWEVPIPDVPNGVAVIGVAPQERGFLQYQFDSRGVARIYSMDLDGDTWRLSRTEPDLSPLDFHQRFTGEFSRDGKQIRGRWESSENGKAWRDDFGLLYRRRGHEAGTEPNLKRPRAGQRDESCLAHYTRAFRPGAVVPSGRGTALSISAAAIRPGNETESPGGTT